MANGLKKAEAKRKAREAEYMSLADGVGIIPTEYRNRAYKKLGVEPGALGILLDDDESRARRGAGPSIDEEKLGAAIGSALAAALAPVNARLEQLEAAGGEKAAPAGKPDGKQKQQQS